MKSLGRYGSSRRVRFEQLEDRNLLAVSVTGDANNLVITNIDGSDGLPDAIDIAVIDNNTINVDGEDYTVSGNITVNLGSDDEVLNIFGDTLSTLPGNLLINGGGGSNFISIGGVNVSGDLTIDNGGSLANTIAVVGLGDFSVGGDLTVAGGDAIDELFFGVGTVNGQFILSAGASDDIVNVVQVQVRDNFFASLGAGDDFFQWDAPIANDFSVAGNLTILAGEGSDSIFGFGGETEPLRVGGGLNILLGGGTSDVVEFFWVEVGGTAVVTGGSGSQNISIADSNLGGLLVTTGGAADTVNLTRTDFAAGIITTGAGNDSVTIEDSEFGLLILLGGGGADTLVVIGVTDPYLALSF